jgi:hypothetical protein
MNNNTFSINYKHIIDKIFNLIKINNDFNKGLFLIIIHNISILFIFLYILIGPINRLYYVFIIFLVIVFIINIIYKGCPLIKLERNYIKNNKWYGSYHILELFNIIPSKNNIVYLSYLWTILFLFIISYRLYK